MNKKNEQYSANETAQRFDAALREAFATAPKP
jgi:hypothetical protein